MEIEEQDLSEPLIGGKKDDSAEKEEDDDSDLDVEVKPHCLGHRFHWVEILMILFIPLGVAFMFASVAGVGKSGKESGEEPSSLPPTMAGTDPAITLSPTIAPATNSEPSVFNYVVGGCGVAANVLGLIFVWNLASVKRVAQSTDSIVQDIKKLKAENKKAKNLQSEMRRQGDKFKQNLGEMQQASMLISGSAKNLEQIQEQEEEMIKDRLKLLEERKDLAEKMQTDMKANLKTSYDAVREQMHERAMLFYQEGVKESGDNGEMDVCSESFQNLKDYLAQNAIEITDEVAGSDKKLSQAELEDFLNETLKTHFERLKDAAIRQHELEMDLINRKIANIDVNGRFEKNFLDS